MPSTATIPWGKWLSERLDGLGISNAEAGRRIGTSGEMVRRYREGAKPGSAKVGLLAELLGVSQPELLAAIDERDVSADTSPSAPTRTADPTETYHSAEDVPPGRYAHLVQAGATWDYELTDPDSGTVRAAVQIRFMVAPDVRRRQLSSGPAGGASAEP